MTGISKLSNQIFLIDFGLAQLFCNPSTRRHVPLISELKTVGTIAFTSINSHLGWMQSHCDDLESLVYSKVYLFHGQLPWQDIKEDSVEKYKEVILEKKTALAKALCQGLPPPLSPSYSIFDRLALMRSHSTITYALSSHNARFMIPTTSCRTSLP